MIHRTPFPLSASPLAARHSPRTRRGVAGLAVALGIGIGVGIAFTPEARAQDSPWLFGAADAQYERAAHLLREGQIEEALSEIEEARSIAPESPRILRLYARVLVLTGQPDRAAAVLEQLGEVAPPGTNYDYSIAVETYRAGDWERARERLLAVASDAPEPGLVYLYLGATEQELGDLDAAEQALARALAIDPSLAGSVAYRRGILALQRADYDDAMLQFEIVLEQLPDTPVANSAREYLDQLARLTPRPWDLFVRAGMGYDSNINLANTDDSFVSSGKKGWRALTSAGGSYQFGDERLGLQLGQTVYGHFYTNGSSFDQQATLTWAWANAAVTDTVEVDVRYGFEFAWADWRRYRSSNNVEPGLTWAITPALAARASFRFEDRTYYLTPATPGFNRDGHVEYIGTDLFYALPSPNPIAENWLRLGYRHRREDTTGDQFNSKGNQPLLTLAMGLPWQIQSIIDARVEWRDYEAISPFQPTAGRRKDRIATVRAGLERLIGPQTSLEVAYRFTDRDSNVNFFVYERHEVSFLATYRY